MAYGLKVCSCHPLSELVLPSTVTYATRSSFDTSLLHIPKTKTAAGDSAFHAAAPQLWNKLPRNIREAPTIHVFKSLLKTHLFSSLLNYLLFLFVLVNYCICLFVWRCVHCRALL